MNLFPSSIILLNPNKYFLGFIEQLFESAKLPKNNLSQLSEDQLRVNSVAISIPNGYTGSRIDTYLEKYWDDIIKYQLVYLSTLSNYFPKDMSFNATEHWFDREHHPLLFWLGADGDELDKNQNIMASIVSPNQQFTAWIDNNREHLSVDIPEHYSLSTEAILKHANVYLSASIQSSARLKQAFHAFSEDILSNEFSMWTTKLEVWPKELDAKCFDQYFNIEPHYQILLIS